MLNKSKLSPKLIKFFKDRNIPEEKWEEYLEKNCTTIDVNKFLEGDNSFLESTMEEIALLTVKNNKPAMTLYETNIMGFTNIGGEKGNDYLRLVQRSKLPYYKLEYFKEFNGQKDVIKETRIIPDEENVILYYTICNQEDETYVLTATLRNDDVFYFSWEQNYGMVSFVIVRFKAFRDRGVTFINDNINTLVDEYPKIMEIKTGAKRLLKI